MINYTSSNLPQPVKLNDGTTVYYALKGHAMSDEEKQAMGLGQHTGFFAFAQNDAENAAAAKGPTQDLRIIRYADGHTDVQQLGDSLSQQLQNNVINQADGQLNQGGPSYFGGQGFANPDWANSGGGYGFPANPGLPQGLPGYARFHGHHHRNHQGFGQSPSWGVPAYPGMPAEALQMRQRMLESARYY